MSVDCGKINASAGGCFIVLSLLLHRLVYLIQVYKVRAFFDVRFYFFLQFLKLFGIYSSHRPLLSTSIMPFVLCSTE